jgi:Fur family peroxide stress response transcriptional regulator
VERFRHLGIKLTPQRLAILSYLYSITGHPSAEDIYKAVSKKFPTMSFATVYNTLDALHEKGCLQILTIDPDKKRYEPNCTPHHHIICVKCKSIVDIQGEFKFKLNQRKIKGFDLLGSQIEFYGICNKCKRMRDKRAI